MKTLLCLIAAGMVACGCAGTRFSFDKARTVQIGMTESTVSQIMGKPYMVTTAGDTTRWVYSYATGFGAARAVSFCFANGKVTEVPNIPDSFH